jgi:hypothetical protein
VIAECYVFGLCLCSLDVDVRSCLAHLLLGVCVGGWFLRGAAVLGCRLIVQRFSGLSSRLLNLSES